MRQANVDDDYALWALQQCK